MARTSVKRWRAPIAKLGQLLIKYGKVDGDEDLQCCWGGGGATRRDSNLLMHVFNRKLDGYPHSFIKELEARGYDITTLKFTIQKKPNAAA